MKVFKKFNRIVAFAGLVITAITGSGEAALVALEEQKFAESKTANQGNGFGGHQRHRIGGFQ